MKEIAKLWSVSTAETLYPANRPIIQVLLFQWWYLFYSAAEIISHSLKFCRNCALISELDVLPFKALKLLLVCVGFSLFLSFLFPRQLCFLLNVFICFLQLHSQKKPFVEIRSSVHLLEKIACSVMYNEPVLLVGETGTGKTTLVQSLATRLGQTLTVLVCPKCNF